MNGKIKENLGIIIVVVIAAIIGSGSYLIKKENIQPTRYYIQNSGGNVLFEHQNHADNQGDCVTCHHTLLQAAETNECSDCHEDGFNKEDFEHEDLKAVEEHTCITCHQTNEEAKPKACRTCHNTQMEEKVAAKACNECHEDDFTKDMMSHDELVELEEHACEGCHEVRSVAVVYHEQCNACHLKESEKLFATAEGKVSCKACHLK